MDRDEMPLRKAKDDEGEEAPLMEYYSGKAMYTSDEDDPSSAQSYDDYNEEEEEEEDEEEEEEEDESVYEDSLDEMDESDDEEEYSTEDEPEFIDEERKRRGGAGKDAIYYYGNDDDIGGDDDDDDDDGGGHVVASRPSSTLPAEEEATANAIIASLQNIMPELQRDRDAKEPGTISSAPIGSDAALMESLTVASQPTVRMTDLGYKISQMVLRRQPLPPSPPTLGEETGGRQRMRREEVEERMEMEMEMRQLKPSEPAEPREPMGLSSEGGSPLTDHPMVLYPDERARGEMAKVKVEGQEEEEEGQDPFLERALSGRRRNRTGVRGRPKKVDYGFGKSTTQDLPPEVARLMGQANMAYVGRHYDQATHLLLEVIRRAPHAVEAYQTLALIHEERGDRERALSYYTIAAHLVRTDADLWRKLASLTLTLGRRDEAIYYLGRLLRMKGAGARAEYYWTRARLLVEREEYKRAILGFDRLLLIEMMMQEEGGSRARRYGHHGNGEYYEGAGMGMGPKEGNNNAWSPTHTDPPVVVGGGQRRQLSTFEQVALLADRLGVLDQGLREHWCQLVEEATRIQGRPPSGSFLYLLLEEFLFTGRAYDLVIRLIDNLAVALVTSGIGTSTRSLPASWFSLPKGEELLEMARTVLLPELRLYYLMALVGLKRAPETDLQWAALLDPTRYGPQLRELGRLLLRALQPTAALTLLLPLMEVPAVGDVELASLIGECYKLVPGGETMAMNTFEALLEMDPGRADARASLADLYRQAGREGEADQLMAAADNPNVHHHHPSASASASPSVPSSHVIPGEEAATFVRRPAAGSMEEIFKGLFEWEDPAATILMTTHGEESMGEGRRRGREAVAVPTRDDAANITDHPPPTTILSHRTRSQAVERRHRKRARRRTRRYTAYSEAQMAAVQEDYRKIMALYEQHEQRTGASTIAAIANDRGSGSTGIPSSTVERVETTTITTTSMARAIPVTMKMVTTTGSQLLPILPQDSLTIIRQIRHLALPLIEDLLSNSALRPAEGIKQLMRTSSLSLLHGLTVEEWHRLACRWLVVETRGGSPERALRLVRILLTRSIFAHQPTSAGHHILLRLLYLGIAWRMRGRSEVFLSATRWWVRHWPALPLATSLLLQAASQAWRQNGEAAVGAPLLRFIQRMARKHRHQSQVTQQPGTTSARVLLNWLALCLHQATERWEGAITAGEALLHTLPTHGPTLLALAVALLHQSVKRTCRQTGLLQARAFHLLHRYLAVTAPDEGNYNMGRACHMMGLLDLATHYYRASLRVPSGRFTREAAYNLHLVALLGGQWDLAKHYLSQIIIS